MPKVRAAVHLMNDKFKRVTLLPGDEIPEWAIDRITNPALLEASVEPDDPEPKTVVPEPEESVDYSTFSKVELIAALTERGLDTKGNKLELIERLTTADTVEEEIDVWGLDVAELKQLAERRDIDLGDAETQAEIATIIEQAGE